MNKKQKTILFILVVAIGITLIFPPFIVTASDGAVYNMGYGWIFEPPQRLRIPAAVDIPLLLTQWAGFIVIGGISFFLAKDNSGSSSNVEFGSLSPVGKDKGSAKENFSTGDGSTPQGVGGWLLVLVVMMLIWPALGAGGIHDDFMAIERGYPDVLSSEKWMLYKKTVWLAFIVFSAISVYGAIKLSIGKDLFAVFQAKIVLWVTGPVASIVILFIIPVVISSEFGVAYFSGQFFGPFLASFVFPTIWTVYLTKSKRVQNTYGGRRKFEGNENEIEIDIDID